MKVVSGAVIFSRVCSELRFLWWLEGLPVEEVRVKMAEGVDFDVVKVEFKGGSGRLFEDGCYKMSKG